MATATKSAPPAKPAGATPPATEDDSKVPWGLFIFGAFGGILFGYDTGIISGANPLITSEWSLSAGQSGFVTASVLIGSMVGALVIGSLSDKYGRKKLLFLSSVLFIIGALGCFFSGGVAMPGGFAVMCTFRIILGLAVGAASSLTPAYLAELADTKHRGTISSMFQLMTTIGILVAYFSNLAFLHHNIAGIHDWRWMLGSAAVPALILLIGSIVLPESPRYLAKMGKEKEARDVLVNRLDRSEKSADEEMDAMIETIKKDPGQGTFKELFSTAGSAVVAAVGLMFFQQLVGINSVIYFLPTIFINSFGFPEDQSIWVSVGVGTVNVISTIVAMFIMDKFNRKSLLQAGSIVMAASLLVMVIINITVGTSNPAVAIVTMVFIALYIIGFAISWGPICWVMIGEIFPLKVRGLGTSVGSAANWIGNFLVSQFFTVLLNAFHNNIAGPFAIFFVFAVLSIFFVRRYVPETKGKSLEQIEAELNERNRKKRMAKLDSDIDLKERSIAIDENEKISRVTPLATAETKESLAKDKAELAGLQAVQSDLDASRAADEPADASPQVTDALSEVAQSALAARAQDPATRPSPADAAPGTDDAGKGSWKAGYDEGYRNGFQAGLSAADLVVVRKTDEAAE